MVIPAASRPEVSMENLFTEHQAEEVSSEGLHAPLLTGRAGGIEQELRVGRLPQLAMMFQVRVPRSPVRGAARRADQPRSDHVVAPATRVEERMEGVVHQHQEGVLAGRHQDEREGIAPRPGVQKMGADDQREERPRSQRLQQSPLPRQARELGDVQGRNAERRAPRPHAGNLRRRRPSHPGGSPLDPGSIPSFPSGAGRIRSRLRQTGPPSRGDRACLPARGASPGRCPVSRTPPPPPPTREWTR